MLCYSNGADKKLKIKVVGRRTAEENDAYITKKDLGK